MKITTMYVWLSLRSMELTSRIMIRPTTSFVYSLATSRKVTPESYTALVRIYSREEHRNAAVSCMGSIALLTSLDGLIV